MASVLTVLPAAAVHGVTRRRFLATSTLLAVTGTIAHAIPVSPVTRRLAPEAFLPDPPPEETLRQLALAGVDAAHAAGADFADIRIGIQRSIAVVGAWPPSVSMFVGYGVRALVNGMWSFQHGSVLTPEAITSAATSAVTGATMYAQTNTRLGQASGVEFADAPVVTGEWHGPMEIDPFTVPLDDYYRAFQSIRDASTDIYRNTKVGGSGLNWNGETRVFASTAGSLVTQHFLRGGLSVGGSATLPSNPSDIVSVDVPGLDQQSGGFELALRTGWVERLYAGMEEAIRIRQLPHRRFQDIGRFPVVLEGRAFAHLMGQTLSAALDGDRALGIEADASGGTFLEPPNAFLGAAEPTFSPLLTVTSDRALPSVMAVGWDDEGVVPVPATLVKDGTIQDYHTTRETAPLLASWYRQHGKPVRSQGRSVAETPASLPACGAGAVSVAPSPATVRTQDWMRDIAHGFVFRDIYATTEPQLSAGVFSGLGLVIEIKQGKAAARTYVSVQFGTKALLKDKLHAVGDASTVRPATVWASKGIPWQGVSQHVTAPAAFLKDVDVFSWNTGE